ncbi:MAG: LytR C-terminal domain-containing protein [Nocardioides sp.]
MIVSIVAVAMAAVAFVATRHQAPTEREITPAAKSSVQPSPVLPSSTPEPIKPQVRRDRVYVEVYNNSQVSGLAARVAARAEQAGWQVVGSDNWYGTIPGSTVYYPRRLAAAGRLLALDLGIRRVQPAVDPMRRDRLTVILTGELTTS